MLFFTSDRSVIKGNFNAAAVLRTRCSSALWTNLQLPRGASAIDAMINNAYRNTIYLTQLKWVTSKKQIEGYFNRFGKDAETGLHRGFALVKFQTLEGVTAAMQKQQHVIDDQVVNLELHIPILNSKQKFTTM